MNPDRIGVMVNNLEPDRLRAFAAAAQLGFKVVHTSALPEGWLTGPERAQYIAAARASGLTIHSMFVGFDGQSYKDMDSIRRTVGLVIPELRAHRRGVAKRYVSLARELGAPSLAMHLGFLPSADNPDYEPLLEAVRNIADCCASEDLTLRFETGQDPAEVLLRFIENVDRANLGVNFDPANFMLYGTDEPVHALGILAPLLRGVHCKDAIASGQSGVLGSEKPLGMGEVPWPELLRELEGCYAGPLVIERETADDAYRGRDIISARMLLTRLHPGLWRSLGPALYD
ncbi:MAG TPA: sugar phosphate isomerase/epimerase family protein [Myxococcaceae bacterium]|nr:sugar phosphate isomerase/epimerase family protein [Myxococcaceae bacterium]